MARPRTAPLPPPESAATIAALLGGAAKGAHIDGSVEEVLPHLNPVALSAVGEALARTNLSIACINGVVDPEVHGWRQLVLTIREPGDTGSDAWFATLEVAGRVMESAVEEHPDLGDDIVSQIALEV